MVTPRRCCARSRSISGCNCLMRSISSCGLPCMMPGSRITSRSSGGAASPLSVRPVDVETSFWPRAPNTTLSNRSVPPGWRISASFCATRRESLAEAILDNMQPSIARMPRRKCCPGNFVTLMSTSVLDVDGAGVGGEQIEQGLRHGEVVAAGLVAGTQRDMVGGAGRQDGIGRRQQFESAVAVALEQPQAAGYGGASGAAADIDLDVLAVDRQQAPMAAGLVERGGVLAAGGVDGAGAVVELGLGAAGEQGGGESEFGQNGVHDADSVVGRSTRGGDSFLPVRIRH